MSSDREMVTIADSVAEKWRWTRATWELRATKKSARFRVMTDILDAAYAVSGRAATTTPATFVRYDTSSAPLAWLRR